MGDLWNFKEKSGEIKVWNLYTGGLLHSIYANIEFAVRGINDVIISPDGHTFVSASKTIQIWNLRTAELVLTFKEQLGYFGSVNSVAISPDGQMFISGSSDQTIKIWRKKRFDSVQ